MEKKMSIGRRFERLVEIMDILRSEQGCPWDREQDERTIVNYFLEEVFEATDAVLADDAQSLKEELGDVLMEVVFLCRIYQEKARFDTAGVLDGIIGKMIRRHPHVFEKQRPLSSREVMEGWQDHKNSEKKRGSVLAGIPRSAPALLQAFQTGQRAASFGFDWENARDVLSKVREELRELESALRTNEDEKVREEIGDALFCLASLSRLAGHNPELALRAATRKFQRRFRRMETAMKKRGRKPAGMKVEEMNKAWERTKKDRLR